MARRAHGDSEKTFDAIVGAAKQVLADDGATELSLRRVAAVAGLSLGTVQYYFSSKAKLIETCLEDHRAATTAQLEGARLALAAGGNIEDIVVAGVSFLYRSGVSTRETQRLRVMKALEARGINRDAPGPFLPSQLTGLAELVSEHSSIAIADARMMVLSAGILVARYSIYDEAELRTLLGLSEDDAGVCDAVDKHLQKLTRGLFREFQSNDG